MGDNLRNHGNQISVSLRADEDGYFGSECPEKECVGYFKVTFGTGIKGPPAVTAPIAGRAGSAMRSLSPQLVVALIAPSGQATIIGCYCLHETFPRREQFVIEASS